MESLALTVAAILISLVFLGLGFGLAIDRAYNAKFPRLAGAIVATFLGVLVCLSVTMTPMVALWPLGGLLCGLFLGWVL